MPIVTPSQFRLQYQIDASIFDPVFENEIALADAMLESWFGTTLYEQIESGQATNRYQASVVQSVGNYLALYFALPALSTRVLGNGVALIVQMPDGTKIEDVTAADLEKKRESLMVQARKLAATIPVNPAFYTTRTGPVLLAPMV